MCACAACSTRAALARPCAGRMAAAQRSLALTLSAGARCARNTCPPPAPPPPPRDAHAAVALVLCLNIGVDPPDVIKISPCARLECWVDPLSMQPAKALETIGAPCCAAAWRALYCAAAWRAGVRLGEASPAPCVWGPSLPPSAPHSASPTVCALALCHTHSQHTHTHTHTQHAHTHTLATRTHARRTNTHRRQEPAGAVRALAAARQVQDAPRPHAGRREEAVRDLQEGRKGEGVCVCVIVCVCV
jgi:hypothetical protein